MVNREKYQRLNAIGGGLTFQIIHITVRQFDTGFDFGAAFSLDSDRDETFILRGDHMVQGFPDETSRVAEKFRDIEKMKPTAFLGDVCGNRTRRTQQLITQAIALFFGQPRG